MRNRIIFITTFLLFVIKLSAQDTIRYIGLINKGLMYESIELYNDNTFKWTSEFDLSYDEYGNYEIVKDTLILNTYIDFTKPKTMSIVDSIKVISSKWDNRRFRKYIIDRDKMFRTNSHGRKVNRLKVNSFGNWFTGHRFKYELIKQYNNKP